MFFMLAVSQRMFSIQNAPLLKKCLLTMISKKKI